MAALGHIQPQLHPIPVDIRKDLPDYWTPWKMSPEIFSQMSSQAGRYKKVQVLPTDPEWRFVWRYFYHDKPYHWGIKRIYCIHERHQQQAFETNLSSIEREAHKFKPNWDQEPRANQRAQAIERWKEATQIFSPFKTVELDGRQRNWDKTKTLPLWHGTSEHIADSIAESGFLYFGKTSLGKTANDPKSTDAGFFGSGIYFSNSARYASDIYSSGHLLMAWVSMREPFPVVGDTQHQDMKTLKGQGAYKHYDAHYAPVVSIDPTNPYQSMYYPAQPGQFPQCDEIVVFHKSHTLPRFWIELTVESPTITTPSNIPLFVNELIPHLFKMLEHPDVDRDQKLRNHLGKELAILLKLPGEDHLDDHGNQYKTLYSHLTQLIVQNKVDRQIRRLITQSTPSPVKQPHPQMFGAFILQDPNLKTLPQGVSITFQCFKCQNTEEQRLSLKEKTVYFNDALHQTECLFCHQDIDHFKSYLLNQCTFSLKGRTVSKELVELDAQDFTEKGLLIEDLSQWKYLKVTLR